MSTFKLGGSAALGSTAERWESTAGIRPHLAEMDFSPQDADKLLAGSLSPVSLEIKVGAGGATLSVKNLYVIQEVSSGNPRYKRVVVADRRWFWNRGHILRRYNMRRRTGFKRLTTPATTVTAPVVENVWYATYSLNPPVRRGRRWTAQEVLNDVLNEIKKIERDATGQAPSVIIDPDVGAKLTQLPIENLELDDNAGDALSRVLSYLPAAGVTIDQDGTIRIYSKAAANRSDAIIRQTSREIQGSGHIQAVELGRIRPKQIDVLFTREMEIRFDFIETGGTSAQPTIRLQNVLPIPDFSLSVGAKGILAQGTYITFTEALEAWGVPPGFTGLNRLTLKQIRQALVPFMDLWAGLRLTGAQDDKADWLSRVAAIQQHYRRTYRIPLDVMDRLLEIRAERVATIDPETGTRGVAPVYGDWSFVATQRSLSVQAAQGVPLEYAMNVTAYKEILDQDTKVTPAKIRIVDGDQGVISIDYVLDEYRVHEMILPSHIDNIPRFDFKVNDNRSWYFNGRGGTQSIPELAADYKLAVILTCIPASPNTDQQLERVTVTPGKVAGLLPTGFGKGIGDARGPTLEVRVGRSKETARIAWSDDRTTEFLKALGLRDGIPNFDGLIINRGLQADIGNVGASIDQIAIAVAAREYARLADRHVGNRRSLLNAVAKIDGFLSSVGFEVATGGAATTDLRMVEDVEQLSMFAAMNEDTRALVLRTAQKGK